MDDSCAVCADTLEWVGYGSCGHKEVCSTCVARLRFICDDRRCCICKSDNQVVFVTKALGDYTRMVSDFSTLPAQVKEGQVGSYWYHEDTQAFFDDAQHYKMIRAMCRLSCSICDKENPGKPNHRFRNIAHLKRHLSNQHGLHMCDLCLEGRKVFICEQKLYTRAQLNRHMRTGDSEVDGTESERGGFAGHPMCEFCRSPFYGENELYSHMSTEHYTCHICQRQHPGQFEYYKDYDDLETHFRHDHFLCEDEACLAKKFTVFQTEADLKRHNALEHGGRMSRSKRNAVLQIPTSFRYRSSNESGQHRGRRRYFRRESSPDHELSMAIEASLARSNANDPVAGLTASAGGSEPLLHRGTDLSDDDPLVQPFESLSTADSESSSRYRQAVAQASTTSLTESLFPPLSTASGNSQQKSQQESQNTMAARLRRKSNATVLNVAKPRPTSSRGPAPATSAAWPAPVSASATSAAWPAPASATSVVRPAPAPAPALIPVPKPAAVNGSGSSSYSGSVQGRPMNEPGLVVGSLWGSRNVGSGNSLNHSNSAPNLSENRSFDPVSDFPPVSAAQPNRLQPTAKPKKTEDVQTANKSLVERMQAALDYDENKYSAFKSISQEYRQGLIGTWEYLDYVKQFDLTHLVLDLARLCPDVQKQRELIEAYNATCQSIGAQETFWSSDDLHSKGNSGSTSRKGKGKKVMDAEHSSRSKEELADNIMSEVKNLQSQLKPYEGEVEVLEKDGYRPSKGKGTSVVGEIPTRSTSGQTTTVDSKSKQKKKSSKFHRNRLGDDSAASVLDVRNSSSDDSSAETGWPKPLEGSSASARSVWGNGGAQRLFAK